MKKRFVPRSAVKESGHSDLHKFPLNVICRNDYLANLNQGEKFWFPGGDVLTLESLTILSGNSADNRIIRVRCNNGKEGLDFTRPRNNCSIMVKATHVFRIVESGELISGAAWSSNVRSGLFPITGRTLMIVNNYKGHERLLSYNDLTSKPFELYKVL